MIDKDTRLCISVSSKPGNFGTTLHNAAYAALGLNFIYKAFAISDIAGAMAGVRALGIRGCSVSMPFKQAVIPHLDRVDETALKIGAVNSVVNDSGELTGHNTDVAGAKAALDALAARPQESVLMLGAGGAARAILLALRQCGFSRARVSSRDLAAVGPLNAILPCEPVPWAERQKSAAELLINATSIGMMPEPGEMPVDESFVRDSRAVMDVVTSPMESKLIACARACGKAVAPGHLMSLHQAMAQFSLYTGAKAPEEVMAMHVRKLMENNG